MNVAISNICIDYYNYYEIKQYGKIIIEILLDIILFLLLIPSLYFLGMYPIYILFEIEIIKGNINNNIIIMLITIIFTVSLYRMKKNLDG